MPDREEMFDAMIAARAGLRESEANFDHLLYKANPDLASKLAEMDALLQLKKAKKLTRAQVQQMGYLLEVIALLAFQELLGVKSVKAFESAGPQHDLLVNGRGNGWAAVCTELRLKAGTGILVECKATTAKVGDPEFQRLGSIVSHHHSKTVGLGVFFSIAGATGFPERGQKGRVLTLKDARVTQVIVYHRTDKPLIVFDWEDIRQLDQHGSLIKLLEGKIREIEEQTGTPTALPSEPNEVLLPAHQAAVCRFK